MAVTDQVINYDDVKRYRLDPEREEELVRTGGECTFIWANKSGHPLGGGKTVTYKGHTKIHNDPEVKQWMYQLLAQGMAAAGQEDKNNAFTSGINPEMFVRFLHTPERIVLEFTPEMSIPFDGDKMAEGTAQAYAAFVQEET